MKWVGLTGSLGTGKSTVAQILRDQGYTVLDADDVAKAVVARGTAGLKAVTDLFGPQFLNSSGELDRSLLAQLVFSKPESLGKLEGIIHPLVQVEVQKSKSLAHGRGEDVVFYDVPLLYEKNISGFDAVIVVASEAEHQQRRLQLRNAWSTEEIERRLKNQLPLEEKIRKATYVIHNNGSLQELSAKVLEILKQIKIVT